MRSRFAFLMTLSALSLAGSTASAQHHLLRPYYGPTYPAQQVGYSEPMAATPVPTIGPTPTAGDSSCCSGVSDCGCDTCCPPLGWFGSAEYNLWWAKGRRPPPLATTSPAGTPQLDVGVLPGAQVLFGGGREDGGVGSGGRLTIGKWLDNEETFAIAGKFWAFRPGDADFNAVSDGTTNLAIPFFDAQLGIENAYLVAFSPDGVTPFAEGSINIEDRIDMLGAEVYAQFLLYDEPGVRFDFIGGYQTMRIDSSLRVASTMISRNVAIVAPVGTTFDIVDSFEGRNEFHGGQVGLSATSYWDRWAFLMSGKIGVGNMHQTIIIDGNTVVTPPGGGAPDVRDEGLFALGTNQGRYERDRVAYIPEVNLKLSYAVLDNLDLSIGYTFLYISDVALGADAIDRNLNLSQTNGGPPVGPNQDRPAFLGFRETDFWAQGINFGIDWRF